MKYADLNKNQFIVLQFMKNVRIAPRPIFLGSQASEPPLEEIGRCRLVFLARSMVPEFVGPSLFYAGSTMSRDLIIDVEIQSLSSLEILHRTGIVHGDLSEFSLRYTSDEHKIYLADLEFASFFPEVEETGEKRGFCASSLPSCPTPPKGTHILVVSGNSTVKPTHVGTTCTDGGDFRASFSEN